MKKLGKIFANILIVAYAVIAIAVTILLLSYNDYHFSVIGGYTFILVTDDELEEFGYEEGSLLLVKEAKAKKINPGDNIFFYRTISTSKFEVEYAEVLLKDETGGEYDISYVIEGGTIVEQKEVIGSTKGLVEVQHLGTILSILESRYGYLFLIVVVSFIAFLYEIYELIMEIKYGDKEEEEEDYEEDDEDEYYEEDDEEEEEVVKPKKKASTTAKKTTTSRSAATTKKSATASKTTAKKSTATKSAATKSAATKAKTAGTKTSTAKKTTTAKATTTKKKTTQAKK